MPSKIFVNDESIKTDIAKKINGLTGKENKIKMIWDSYITNCGEMFKELDNIKIIDLSKFDSSLVENMKQMFFKCKSLISIDLTNFKTSYVTNMEEMFSGCSKLQSLDLKYFDTSLVTTMENMFSGCNKLISLDLKNFNTSSVKTMMGMFYTCKNLESLDLNNFDTSSVINMHGMFNHCNKIKSLNINNFDTTLVTDMIDMFRNCQNLISLNLNNFNLSSIIKMNDIFRDINKDIVYCINEENLILLSQIESNKLGIITNDLNICISNCSDDDIYIYEYEKKCYKECPMGTHISINNTNTCEKNEDLQTNFTIIADFFNNIIYKTNDSQITKDDIIFNIQDQLSYGLLDSLISKNIFENKNDLQIKENDTLYQITSPENQNSKQYNNISSIHLGECEKKLIEYYNLNENNENLFIFKIDTLQKGFLIPIIDYEVYDYEKKRKLNLSICKNTKIKIEIPVSINENNLFKYNSSSNYYNDICNTYTTEKGTDIVLNDRKNEFINNNMSLCEANCEYKGYDFDSKKSLCECEVKRYIPLFSKFTIDKDKFLKKFTNLNKEINLSTMKCIKLVFSEEGQKNNIGSFILLTIILINIIILIYFKIKGFNYFLIQINKILNGKNIHNDIILKSGISIYKRDSNKIEKDIIIRKDNLSENKENKDILKNFSYNSPIDSKKNGETNSVNSVNNNLRNIDSEKNSKINLVLPNSNQRILFNKKISEKDTLKKNDYELNNLSYKDALKFDKRKYIQYYFSLLKRKQVFLFTFYIKNDYNSKVIKISLFLFSFALYYTVNALFFYDSTMHKIYEDEGYFNFLYKIPLIIYSTVISGVISAIIKFLSLSEKNILEIKNEKKKEKINNKISEVIKCLKIKFFFFFLLDFIFLILFWYYLSSFCAVYKNTQSHLIKDTLISFGLSLLYPFVFNLIPGIFRIKALNSKNNDKECIYKISKIIQIL